MNNRITMPLSYLNLFPQVRVVLLPLKKQKYKSKIRNGENPQYMESFVFHKINPGEFIISLCCFI